MAHPAPRIVSLVPSLTELVCALGLGPHLVGRTRFCIHPAAELAGVARLGGTKQVNEQELLALAPSHLIVNKDENSIELVERLRPHIPEIIVTHPLVVDDNLALFQQFASVFAGQPGVAGKAEALAADMRHEINANHAFRQSLGVEPVLYLIWKNPWMTVAANTFIASMLASVGWQAIAGTAQDTGGLAEVGASRYPVLSEAQLLEAPCRRLLLSSEPYRFRNRHVDELQARLDAPATSGRTAHLIDGEMCSWYGPRAIAGMQYLRKLRATLTS